MRCGNFPAPSTRDIDPTPGLAQVKANGVINWHHGCWSAESNHEFIVLMMLTSAWFREIEVDENSLKIMQSIYLFFFNS